MLKDGVDGPYPLSLLCGRDVLGVYHLPREIEQDAAHGNVVEGCHVERDVLRKALRQQTKFFECVHGMRPMATPEVVVEDMPEGLYVVALRHLQTCPASLSQPRLPRFGKGQMSVQRHGGANSAALQMSLTNTGERVEGLLGRIVVINPRQGFVDNALEAFFAIVVVDGPEDVLHQGCRGLLVGDKTAVGESLMGIDNTPRAVRRK